MTISSVDAPRAVGKVSAATRALNVISLGILAIGVAGLGFHNLGNRYFWTDESSTFYAGLGWPAPGATPASISAAWDSTMNGFLDPGIFHMLVRFWAINFGAETVSLRLIPFVFFLTYVGSILGLARLLGAPLFVGAGIAGLMLLENITPYYSVELRPYSAGLAAAVVLPLVALWLIKSPSTPRLLTLLAGVVVFGSMQYNSMPITWALALALVLAWWWNRVDSHSSYLLIASAFVLLWQPILYFISRGSPLQSTGGNSLDYIPDLVLTAMPTDRLLEVITSNLLSPTALPRTIFVILIPVLWWRRWLPRKLANVDWGVRCINYLWLIVLVATLSTVVLAILGLIPWILGTRWSIAEVGLIALSTTGLTAIVVKSELWKNPRIFALVGVVAVLAATVGATRLWLYERPNDVDVMSTFAPVILSGKPGGTVIDVWSYPTIRYWMEFSGNHHDLFEDWVAHNVSPTIRFDEADSADIEVFLESDSDRLLLRSEAALKESAIDLPAGIEVISYQPQSNDGQITIDLPILLVKK
jgi:hypothetical protein